MEETLEHHTKSLVAPIIFIFIFTLQLLDKYLAHLKTKASVSENDAQLRAEIKQLLKEAAALSEPSTFAQSAKLRRMAAAKERESLQKILTYLICIVCFWRSPVAAISKELVQPFGPDNQNMRCKAQASSLAEGSRKHQSQESMGSPHVLQPKKDHMLKRSRTSRLPANNPPTANKPNTSPFTLA
ncbi:hypothetical protein R6Q57_022670 [Mikania cordata]